MFCDVTGELLYLWHQSYRNSPKTLTLHSPNSSLKRTRSPHVLTQAPHQILKSPPCSQHLWETLPPRSDLSKLDTPNNKPHLLYFLQNALQFRWSFLLFSLFCFQPVLRPVQDYKNANSQGFPVRIHLHGWNVSQLQRCQKRNEARKETWIQIREISVAHGQPPLLYSENYYKPPQQQHSCPLRWLALSRIADTRQPVASKLS